MSFLNLFTPILGTLKRSLALPFGLWKNGQLWTQTDAGMGGVALGIWKGKTGCRKGTEVNHVVRKGER